MDLMLLVENYSLFIDPLAGEEVELDEEALESLKALGYLG